MEFEPPNRFFWSTIWMSLRTWAIVRAWILYRMSLNEAHGYCRKRRYFHKIFSCICRSHIFSLCAMVCDSLFSTLDFIYLNTTWTHPFAHCWKFERIKYLCLHSFFVEEIFTCIHHSAPIVPGCIGLRNLKGFKWCQEWKFCLDSYCICSFFRSKNLPSPCYSRPVKFSDQQDRLLLLSIWNWAFLPLS